MEMDGGSTDCKLAFGNRDKNEHIVEGGVAVDFRFYPPISSRLQGSAVNTSKMGYGTCLIFKEASKLKKNKLTYKS